MLLNIAQVRFEVGSENFLRFYYLGNKFLLK